MRLLSCPGALLVALFACLPSSAQAQITIATDQPIGTAFAVAVEPALHFVNRNLAGTTGSLSADGIGFGSSARAMVFPLARPDGALGFGVQGSLSYSQLTGDNGGLLVGSGGVRYVLGQPRFAYWLDANLGYGAGSELGNAPWFDIGVGWQFALTPSFMWGIVGRWGIYLPSRNVTDSCAGAPCDTVDVEYNYSLLSLALTLEWGPRRWQEPAVAPIPMAQLGPSQPPGPQPQTIPTQPSYPSSSQSQPVVPQQGPAPNAQPRPVGPQPGHPTTGQPQPPGPPSPAIGLYSASTDPDQDRDGIPDASDACVAYAEDRNGHDDGDGCPDADRDGDSVPDVLDQCVSRPEDFDSVRDEDGCPE